MKTCRTLGGFLSIAARGLCEEQIRRLLRVHYEENMSSFKYLKTNNPFSTIIFPYVDKFDINKKNAAV
jgi:hypothetical protein